MKHFLYFLGGLSLGCFLGVKYSEKHFESLTRKEIEEVRQHFKARIQEIEAEHDEVVKQNNKVIKQQAKNIKDADVMIRETTLYADEQIRAAQKAAADAAGEALARYGQTSEIEETTEESKIPVLDYDDGMGNFGSAANLAPINVRVEVPAMPLLIAQEAFFNTDVEFQEYHYTFYAGDKVLTDKEERELSESEIRMLIGMSINEMVEKFGWAHDEDEDVLYFRNFQMKMDVEITRNQGRYSQDVMGLGG